MSAAFRFPRSLRTNVSNPDFLTKYEVQTYKNPGPTIFMIKPGELYVLRPADLRTVTAFHLFRVVQMSLHEPLHPLKSTFQIIQGIRVGNS